MSSLPAPNRHWCVRVIDCGAEADGRAAFKTRRGPAPGGPARRAVAGASFCGLSQLPRGSQARPPPVGPWRSWGGVGSFPDPRRPGTGSLSSRLSL